VAREAAPDQRARPPSWASTTTTSVPYGPCRTAKRGKCTQAFIPNPNPSTSALGVADDVGVLCAAVGLDRLAVLGISVGAPFALACAVRFPQRLGSLLLSSPMGPWELPETRAGMSRRNRRYFTLARRAPLLSQAACWLWARMALAGLRGDRDRLLQRLSKALPPPDREVLAEVAADPQRWDRFVDDSIEALRQGGAGVRADLAVASRGASRCARSACRPICGTGRRTRTCRSRPPGAWRRRSPTARSPSPTRAT